MPSFCPEALCLEIAGDIHAEGMYNVHIYVDLYLGNKVITQ